MSKEMGATTIWYQSGLSDGGASDPMGYWLSEADSTRARSLVESQGLVYVDQPHILDAITRLS